MNGEQNLGQEDSSRASDVQAWAADILADIRAEFEVAMGSPARVRTACDKLRACFGTPAVSRDLDVLYELLPFLAGHTGALAVPLFDLFVECVAVVEDPWPLLQGMLASRDNQFVERTLEQILSLAQAKRLVVDQRIAACLAEHTEANSGSWQNPKRLQMLARIMRYLTASVRPAGKDPLTDLYLQSGDCKLRRLAARLLDLDAALPAGHLARHVLGPAAYQFLAPYLAYTRATHLDLLELIPMDGQPPPSLPDLQAAEKRCGRQLLQAVIAKLGWRSVNFGLSVRKYIRMAVGNSPLLMLLPAEASLLGTFSGARCADERFLFIAHGGAFGAGGEGDFEQGPVARFKAYNLAHAEVLAELLSLTPLGRDKIKRILNGMDRLVEDFTQLFAGFDQDGKWLGEIYAKLRRRIMAELQKQKAGLPVSAELTRLVQMFQDPKSLDDVQTLHGLKRYLHQRGLRLGFRLVESNRGADRSVHLATASAKTLLQQYRGLRYVDFESRAECYQSAEIPYAVRLVVEGFGRQMLYGHEDFPGVNVFCYGNEVHYYLSFLNHPAFLRIDYSPPLRGGMIDLEYYGVSKNELELHPNLSLDAIQQFFQQMEFDITVEMTHIHARYDKERALNVEDLCRKAAALFCLAPYLMEIDWVIGSLALSIAARHVVARAWARFFTLWEVLPLHQMLTRDGKGILIERIRGPAGDQERAWTGEGPYRGNFRLGLPENFVNDLQNALLKTGLDIDPLCGGQGHDPFGQVQLERFMLQPLRDALESGAVITTPAGPAPASREVFQAEWSAGKFAEILSADRESMAAAASLAQLIAALESDLKFQTTGDVNGYDVQYAPLTLPGDCFSLYVLRDQEGIIRLALFSRGRGLHRSRRRRGCDWRSNASLDFSELAARLRRSNYLPSGTQAISTMHRDVAADICARFRTLNPNLPAAGFAGESVLRGIKVSPGRCAGTVVLGTADRSPDEVDGAILVTPSIRPQDNSFLYRAAGIVSTGGGILSHAGLTVIQFRKPALMISARWHQSVTGVRELHYDIEKYRLRKKEVFGYRVSMRTHRYRETHRLSEGDLAVLDAVQGTLVVLGHDPDVLTFYKALQHLGAVSMQLAEAGDPRKIMALRGRGLRYRYQIEKVLERTGDALAARYMVQEILISEHLSSHGGRSSEKAQLLAVILHNQNVGQTVRKSLLHFCRQLDVRHAALHREIRHRIPVSVSMYEILFLRIKLLRMHRTLNEVRTSLQNSGVDTRFTHRRLSSDSVDSLVRERLGQIRNFLMEGLFSGAAPSKMDDSQRFRVHQIQHIERIMHTPTAQRETVERLGARIADYDRETLARIATQSVLRPQACSFGVFPLIGWKAANLAEIERLAGPGRVPQWFVVTDRAFREMLDLPLEEVSRHRNSIPSGASVREGIEDILARDNPDNFHKSRLIRQLWQALELPPKIAAQIAADYHRLVGSGAGKDDLAADSQEVFVSIRSSAREEDGPVAARAGEFDTFLFVRGENQLLQHVKMAWGGLWTERAIHNRALLGMDTEFPGGGVIVQKIVEARVSGVLQTVNAAEENLREMVISAGLGMGEGIVSGIVAADHIIIDKQTIGGDGPLRLRYVIADKRHQVVFNKRAGQGTLCVDTLYHQRLRAALEYVEIRELVDIANQLEGAYGYPLDIEFAIEGTRLWILQVRPIVTFTATLQETLQHYPLQV